MSNDESISLTPDALISLVVIEAQAREQKRISQLEQQYPVFNPSSAFKKRMSLLVNRFHAQKRITRIRSIIKSSLIAATASISLFSISMLPSAPVREAVKGTLIVWQEKCASIFFTNSDEFRIDMPVSIQINCSLENFTLESLDTFEKDGRYEARCLGPEDSWYVVWADHIGNGTEIALDNEYSRYYSIAFNNHPALWTSMQDGSNYISWSQDGIFYMVYGTPDLAELLSVAESIVTTH